MAATLAVGFGTVWCFLAIWLGTSVYDAWLGGEKPPLEYVVFMPDGTPLILTLPQDNLSLATYRDLNGNTHDPLKPQEQLQSVSMPGEHEQPPFFESRLNWDRRIKAFMDEREPAANWYFVHDGKPQGAGYFVGYERISNRLIGYIGLSGFHPRIPSTDDWIPVRAALMVYTMHWSSVPSWYSGDNRVQVRPYRWDVPPRLVHVPSGNQLRLVDLNARTVATVFEAPEPIESVGVPILSSASGDYRAKQQPIQVRTKHKIYTIDQNHHVTRQFTIPPEIDPRCAVSWYELGDGRAIAEFFRPSTPRNSLNLNHRSVYRIAADGLIQERYELSLQSRVRAQNEQAAMNWFALGCPAPGILLTTGPFLMMESDPKLSFPTVVGVMLRKSWPVIVALLAVSSALAWLAWRRGGGFGLDRRDRIVWAVFVLLTGVPGYAGFLLAHRWPAREPCPNCRANVPRDREACAECGTLFPEPALKGIEIFA